MHIYNALEDIEMILLLMKVRWYNCLQWI